MTRFLLCSFALVLLYPSGIDMYLVGLPRIAQDLGASEAQLHIAFSVYLAGMASAMLFAGRISDRSGRKPVAIVGAAIFVIASLLCAQAHTSSHFLTGRFIQGIGAGWTLVAVNGEAASAEVLREAVTAAKGTDAPIELLVRNGERYRTVAFDYHDGLRYPRLERIEGTPDRLGDILTPRRR